MVLTKYLAPLALIALIAFTGFSCRTESRSDVQRGGLATHDATLFAPDLQVVVPTDAQIDSLLRYLGYWQGSGLIIARERAPTTYQYLEGLTARIDEAARRMPGFPSTLPSTPPRVVLLDSLVANAFAIPKYPEIQNRQVGLWAIFVFKGVLVLPEGVLSNLRDSTLAFVLAHELAHVTRRHRFLPTAVEYHQDRLVRLAALPVQELRHSLALEEAHDLATLYRFAVNPSLPQSSAFAAQLAVEVSLKPPGTYCPEQPASAGPHAKAKAATDRSFAFITSQTQERTDPSRSEEALRAYAQDLQHFMQSLGNCNHVDLRQSLVNLVTTASIGLPDSTSIVNPFYLVSQSKRRPLEEAVRNGAHGTLRNLVAALEGAVASLAQPFVIRDPSSIRTTEKEADEFAFTLGTVAGFEPSIGLFDCENRASPTLNSYQLGRLGPVRAAQVLNFSFVGSRPTRVADSLGVIFVEHPDNCFRNAALGVQSLEAARQSTIGRIAVTPLPQTDGQRASGGRYLNSSAELAAVVAELQGEVAKSRGANSPASSPATSPTQAPIPVPQRQAK